MSKTAIAMKTANVTRAISPIKSKRPEYFDFVRVMAAFGGSDAAETQALYNELAKLGPRGLVATNLFRARRTMELARYRVATTSAMSLLAIVGVMSAHPMFAWGWGIDGVLKDGGSPNCHVLYVDLPTGQVAFNTRERGEGPDFPGTWDGARGQSATRICRWATMLLAEPRA